MGKLVLSFDLGDSSLKIAELKGGLCKCYTEQVPENLINDGVVQMPHMLTDFLKRVKKSYHLQNGECALVLPNEATLCRSLTFPAMTVEQLMVNLPFEFSDYISGNQEDYVFDYDLEEMINDEAGKPKEMRILGAVTKKETVLNYIEMFKDAGLKLRTLVPQDAIVRAIMKKSVDTGKMDPDKEVCLINLGHHLTQVYIFKGKTQEVLRNIPMGNEILDKLIAENEKVDQYKARNLKNMNENDVLSSDYCKEVYSKFAVEIMKIINFYRYNNRESTLNDMYFFGGGSHIEELCNAITGMNDLYYKDLSEILPAGMGMVDATQILVQGLFLMKEGEEHANRSSKGHIQR